MDINWFKTIIESNLFANLCQFFSALGTVGAVIVSLVLTFLQNRVKVKISFNNCNMIPTSLKNNIYISGYSVTIYNCSNEKNIYLKQGLYMIKEKKSKKESNSQLLIPLAELGESFIAPKVLGPGEEFMFFISEKQINGILESSSKEKIKFYFMDKANKKYKFKIPRKEFIKQLNVINKNKDKILPL